MKKKIRLITALLAGIEAVTAASAWAHKGYMTTYSHHVEKGEVEIMALNDFTSPSARKREEDGQGDYFSQMMELKYNPTNRLALEFMWEWFQDMEKGTGKLTGFRYEVRYRLFADEVPLNPMVYVEYENLHPSTRYKMEVSGWVDPPYAEVPHVEPAREKIMESRLILSQDFGSWNIAFNWINESDLQSGRNAFGYSTGIFYRIHEKVSHEGHAGHMEQEHPGLVRPMFVSFEFFGALGDDRRLGFQPSRQEQYFQPGITFHLGRASMLTIGYAMGLSKSSDDLMRLNWGYKF